MTATRDAAIAARVPHDLRADLEELAERDGVKDLSIVIRRLLRRGADEELGRVAPRGSLLAGGQGARRRGATATEAAAALRVAPRVGSARFKALAEYELAGSRGLTADDVVVKLEPAPHNGTARRVTDLLQGGLIAPYRVLGGEPGIQADGSASRRGIAAGEKVIDGCVVRLTRADAWAQVYVITAAGHRALEDARAKSRSAAR